MTGIIYTTQRSKLSKKQRAAREQLLKEQRAIKKQFQMANSKKVLTVSDTRDTRSSPSGVSSMDPSDWVASKRPVPVYTGDLMIGIGQMHKSNAVPIFKQQDAVDIAGMRR